MSVYFHYYYYFFFIIIKHPSLDEKQKTKTCGVCIRRVMAVICSFLCMKFCQSSHRHNFGKHKYLSDNIIIIGKIHFNIKNLVPFYDTKW